MFPLPVFPALPWTFLPEPPSSLAHHWTHKVVLNVLPLCKSVKVSTDDWGLLFRPIIGWYSEGNILPAPQLGSPCFLEKRDKYSCRAPPADNHHSFRSEHFHQLLINWITAMCRAHDQIYLVNNSWGKHMMVLWLMCWQQSSIPGRALWSWEPPSTKGPPTSWASFVAISLGCSAEDDFDAMIKQPFPRLVWVVKDKDDHDMPMKKHHLGKTSTPRGA